MPPHGIVAFDLDGTLVRIWSAWSWIHRLLGTLEAAKPNADQYYAGKINYIQWAELDVALWHGIPLTRIKEAIDEGMVFIPHVKPLIETLHEHKIYTAIISSGLSVFADRAREFLGIDISKANKLVTDEEGKICGVEVNVAFDNKDEVLQDIANEMDISLTNCVAIGDSRNDIPMFQTAGFSIAFNPTQEEVARAASIVIESEDALELLPPLLEHFKLKPHKPL